eukprot:Em0015g95a
MATIDRYPLDVQYCGVCGMPPEYCEYSGETVKCHEWMKTNLPSYYSRLVEKAGEKLDELTLEESKRQTRGGKGLRKNKKKEGDEDKGIQVSRSLRSKKKCVTVVTGMKTFGIDLKKASKMFAQHFSCGSSVTGEDEIGIQGDVGEDIVDFITEKWPEVDEELIELIGDQKG